MGVVTGMKFGVTADFVYFDATRWSSDQKKAIVKAMKKAAKAWLAAILERTPRDSGFLVSGFANLAAALGVSISGGQFDRNHSLKRGLDAYGKMVNLNALENRYRDLRDLGLNKDWIKPKFKGKKITGYGRNIPKALSKKQLRARSDKYGLGADTPVPSKNRAGTYGGQRLRPKKKKKRTGSTGTSDATREKIGGLLEQGLNIQGSLDSGGEKKSANLFKREQNLKFYAQQRERKAADKLFKRLAKLRLKIREGRISYNRAADREKPLKMKKRPKYYKWEEVEIQKTRTVQKEVEVENPAYPKTPRALIEARKKGPLPPKTIKQLQSVSETYTKKVKRKVKAGSDKDFVNVYRKRYYPAPKVKGPIKSPLSGVNYGTPITKIFQLEEGRNAPVSISEETTEVNKKGFEVGGKELALGKTPFTPASSLGSFKFTEEANLKITFNYGVDIRYWKIMDQYGRWTRNGKPVKGKGAPWGAFVKANLAYQKILKDELAAAILPFQNYTVKTTSKFAPGFKGGLI